MTILLTGIDGYMGWPTALKLAKEFPDEQIVGIDNFGRRKWVEEGGADTIIPIQSMEKRIEASGFNNIKFIEGDLTDRKKVYSVVEEYKPKTILHMASQPSAPYSHIDGEHAGYTQKNNVLANLNLIWALKDMKIEDTHFIETTTTGVYGAPNITIPEGFIDVVDSNGEKDNFPYPCMASSWYHVTKGFDAINMRLANMQSGIPMTDVRTAIVYGTDSEETKGNEDLNTRFDVDFFFGTLFNRWVSMALIGTPLTVYGSGNQIKPLIHLEDSCQSLVNVIKEGNSGKFEVLNQTTEDITIGVLAEKIKDAGSKALGIDVEIENIPNPRKENESSKYTFERGKFMKVLGTPKYTMEGSIEPVLEKLNKYKDRVEEAKSTFIK